MIKRFVTVLLIVFSLATSASSQSVLGNFTLFGDKIKNVSSFPIGDTILLSVEVAHSTSGVHIKNLFQINPDGSSHDFRITMIDDAPLCSVTRYDSGYYLQYLTGNRKSLELKAMTYNLKTKKQKLLDGGIELNGKLIGSWNNGNLWFVIYDKDTNQIRVVQIDNMEVKSEKTFDLPVDLREHYQGLSFLPEGQFTTFTQGASKFKLFKVNTKLVLTIDYAWLEGNSDTRTEIVTMDIESGTQTVQKIADNTRSNFRSFIYHNALYRTSITKKNYVLRINDLATGALLGEKKIVRDTTLKESYIYRRIGTDFRISGKETLHNMMKLSAACLPSIIVSEEDSCHTSLIWGTYYDEKGQGTFFGPNVLVGLVTMVAVTAIKQMGEGPGISRYFYLENSCDQPYLFKENSAVSLRQQIDDYEIALDLKRIFSDYKGYFNFQGGVVGVYQGHREEIDKLTVIKFEKKNTNTSN